MPKGYWVVHLTVENAGEYEKYRAAIAGLFAAYGARFLIRGGSQEVVEGQQRPRTVVIEFDTIEAARECYHSESYQEAKALRTDAAISDLVIVEGYDG